ncbi:MAG: MltR family transcriptional regulator, partial [Anaerolineae bacterium]
AVGSFMEQLDRGTALVAAAWLDDALEACIRAAFRPDKGTADELFRPDGPLSSLAARIKLAYLLDLIEPTARKDLDCIRRIRNDFAHARGDLRFTTPTIRDRCRQLHGAYACQLGGWTLRSPKQKFVVTSYFLAEYLMSVTKPRKRNPLLDNVDSYGSWIRRTVKSSSLAHLAAELEKLDAGATPNNRMQRTRPARGLAPRR